MKTYLKSIKNISESNLIFDNYTLTPNTTYVIDNNLKKINNFDLINIYFFSGKLEIIDNNNVIIYDNKIFDTIWSFWKPINVQKDLNPNYYLLYDYLTYDAIIGKYYDFSQAPQSVDYIKDVNIRFARKETFTRGFLTNVEYFESSTTGENNITYYTKPILNVNMKYHINDIGYVEYRETKRKWVRADGLYSTEYKTTTKKYNGIMSREEAIQRRNNIINQLIIDIVSIAYSAYYLTKTFNEVELMVLPLLDSLENETNKYIKGNLQPLILGIMNADTVQNPWLLIPISNGTLHDYIENKLLEAILTEGIYTSTEPS